MPDNAVTVKDHLIKIINDAKDANELASVCRTIIIPVLTHTVGFWVELSYCYKAAEIATRCQREIEDYMTWHCQHHKTIEMLTKVRDELRLLGEAYYVRQQNCLAPK